MNAEPLPIFANEECQSIQTSKTNMPPTWMELQWEWPLESQYHFGKHFISAGLVMSRFSTAKETIDGFATLLTPRYVCVAIELTEQHLTLWNWPYYSVPETEAVTEEVPPHFRFVVGGTFRTQKYDIDVEGQAAVAPGYSPAHNA